MNPSVLPPDLNGYVEAHAAAGLDRRLLLRILGGAAGAAALAGVFVPLLPATPFALAAAWAFARSSPRLEARMLSHPRFGPPIRAWRERRAIPRRAKAAAAVSLSASWAALWVADLDAAALTASALVLASVGGWLISRPA